MKIKILVAAVALAASANSSAAILSSINAFGQSEAVFSIWDPTTNQSYALDLGTTWQTFRDNLNNTSFSLSYNVNTAAGSVYDAAVGSSNTANLIWNVSVADSQYPDFSNFTDFGVIGTSNIGNVINGAALGQAVVKHDQYATALRGSMMNDGFGADTIADVNNDPALNDEYFGTILNGGYAGNGKIWDTSWATNGSTNNTAAFGTDLDFYYWQTGGFSTNQLITKAAGSWSFDGATLAYAAPSTVPVPAAAWLFGSGLLGLVGVARRRNIEA